MEQNPRILLVDDEPHMLKTLRQLFAPKNYSISTAQCGGDAINCLSRQEFDLCVLDLIMPGMTGHDVMDYINNSRLPTEIVVLSGDNHIDAAISALKHKAVAFIRKPFNPHELLNTVADVLKRQMLREQKKVLHQKIRESERLHRYLSNQFPDFIYLLDKSGKFIFVNKRVEPLLGYATGELVGKHFTTIICESDMDSAKHAFSERRSDDRATRNLKVKLRGKGGHLVANASDFRIVDIELNSIGVYSNFAKGTKTERGTLGVAREISLRNESKDKTNFQAYHDNLTGLPNRWLLTDRLNLALDHAKRHGHLLVVMFIDLDGFKEINDSLGHRTGDKVLQMFAERLRSGLRAGDTLARFGGDEFILMLPHIGSIEQIEVIADKILGNISKPLIIDGKGFSITASIGVSVYPKDGDSKDSLIERADSAMYRVKKGRKNGYCFYSTQHESDNDDANQGALFDVLELNQLLLAYQPIMSRDEKLVVGLETFLRWQHPSKGLIFPDEFLPMVQEYGLMPHIDDWVIKRVCSDFDDLSMFGLKELRIAVNVSVEKICEAGFVDSLELILARNKFSGVNLQIEVPTRILQYPADNLLEKMNKLALSGIKIIAEVPAKQSIQIEDLKKYQFNGIKIDCAEFDDSSDDTHKLVALAASAKQAGLTLTAKNVDSDQNCEWFNRVDFDLVQGFLYYHPLSLDTAKKFLSRL